MLLSFEVEFVLKNIMFYEEMDGQRTSDKIGVDSDRKSNV